MNYIESLDKTIRDLEKQRDEEKILLREQFNTAFESIKPANLIRSAVTEITESPELKENLLGYAIGIGTGYLTKKAVVGSTHNPLKNLLGTLLQFGVTNIVSKKSDFIKSAGAGLLKLLLSKKKRAEQISEKEKRFDEALFLDSSALVEESRPIPESGF